jgi:hypothetical protein
MKTRTKIIGAVLPVGVLCVLLTEGVLIPKKLQADMLDVEFKG